MQSYHRILVMHARATALQMRQLLYVIFWGTKPKTNANVDVLPSREATRNANEVRARAMQLVQAFRRARRLNDDGVDRLSCGQHEHDRAPLRNLELHEGNACSSNALH